jgi:hypothetical protein
MKSRFEVIRRPWTADEDARLLELHRSGATDEQIGEALGRTWKSVRVHRDRLQRPQQWQAYDAERRKPVAAPRQLARYTPSCFGRCRAFCSTTDYGQQATRQ